MKAHDVLIIGAGMAGASLAWRLARDGLGVAVVEREAQPGMHSTGRSAAMFMESYGPPGVRALTRASRAFYLNPPPGFADAPLPRPRGALFVATAAQQDALARMRAGLAASGTAMVLLDSERIARMVPGLKPGLFQNALLDEHSHDIDVHALLQGFLRGARQAGAAGHGAEGWTVRLSGGGELRARTVVNAAGAWVDEVAPLFGARPIGIEPRSRGAFTFRPPEGVDVSGWPLVADVEEAGTSSPTPASCWARRPTPTRCRRTTCSRRRWTSPWASTASRRPPRWPSAARRRDRRRLRRRLPRLLLAGGAGRLRHPERGRREPAGGQPDRGRAAAGRIGPPRRRSGCRVPAPAAPCLGP